jgi:hypothetical protein
MSSKDSSPPKPTFADVVKAGLKDNSSAVTTTPPPPAVVPESTPKPEPKVTTKVIASCPGPSPQERGYPLGFESEEQFDKCMKELEAALAKEGIKATAVGVRGSSVTVVSLNPRKKGNYFDKKGPGTSDVDVFFVTKEYLKSNPSNGFFHPDGLAKEYPSIDEWNRKWSKELKRDVTAAAFKPVAKMKPTSDDSIVHSGAL